MKRSKIFLLSTVVAAASLFSGCELVKDLVDIEFTTGFEEVTLTIDPTEAGVYVFNKTYLQADLEQKVEDHGGDIENLKNVKVEEISLEILEGEPDFSAFDYLEVYVSTENHSDVLIGSAVNIVDDVIALSMDVTDTDLKEILEEDEYIVTLSGALDKDIPEKTVLLMKIKYSIVVGP